VGDKPVVVLAAGLAADLSMWEPQLSLAGPYDVLRYDIRGHGGTEATPGDYSLDLLAQDVLALLDLLSVQRVHFIGTSLGGMVGQFLAIHSSSRLLSLTLCATQSVVAAQAWDQRVEAVRRNGVAPQIEGTIDRWFTPGYRSSNPQAMQAMREMVLRTSKDGYAGCTAAIRDMNLFASLASICVPTLVIAGDDDLSTPLNILRDIASAIPGAKLVRIPDAAHMPTFEQPAQCNAAIREFLDAVSTDTGSG
jgi:3-oxoadipate enol-lactonase